jgi:ring-1,2-phenylacetyl-CoA epoxidase subunit PaaE
MDQNYALADEEIKDGFILTCQSHPVSPRLLIDFDIR